MGDSNKINKDIHFEFTNQLLGKIDFEEYYNIYSERHNFVFDNEIFKNEFLKISKIINEVDGDTLYDLGCGTGYWISSYNCKISDVVLVDISEKMLIKAIENIKKTDLNYVFFKDNIFNYLENTTISQNNCILLFSFVISHFNINEIDNLKCLIFSIFPKKSKIIIIDSIYEKSSMESILKKFIKLCIHII